MTRIIADHPLASRGRKWITWAVLPFQAANYRNFRREHSLSRAVVEGGWLGGTLTRSCGHGAVQRFNITIEGPNWKDVEDLELPQLPAEGDAIETKYGTCIVTQVEPSPDSEQYAGKMVCRLP
jgi:hypothetical protein